MKFVQRRCCCKPRRFPNCDDEDITGKRCRKNRQCGRGGKCAEESYEIPNRRKKRIFSHKNANWMLQIINSIETDESYVIAGPLRTCFKIDDEKMMTDK